MNDLRSSSKAIIGVIAFASSVAGILIEIFNFNAQITIGVTLAVTILITGSVLFISRVEHRSNAELRAHIAESSKTFEQINESLECLRHMTADVRRDTLRIQLRSYIKNEPENLDTILTIANEYFCQYHGNWIAHHEFLEWADKHSVRVPGNIMDSINNTIADHK